METPGESSIYLVPHCGWVEKGSPSKKGPRFRRKTAPRGQKLDPTRKGRRGGTITKKMCKRMGEGKSGQNWGPLKMERMAQHMEKKLGGS